MEPELHSQMFFLTQRRYSSAWTFIWTTVLVTVTVYAHEIIIDQECRHCVSKDILLLPSLSVGDYHK